MPATIGRLKSSVEDRHENRSRPALRDSCSETSPQFREAVFIFTTVAQKCTDVVRAIQWTPTWVLVWLYSPLKYELSPTLRVAGKSH